jgi:hypothetical protein
MLTVRLERLGKGRIWLDELPEIAFEPVRLEERVLAAGPGEAPRHRAAVEMLLPRGPMAMYGALGAVYTPAPGGSLVIQVGTAAPGKPFAAALAAGIDEVRVSLPEELVAATLRGLAEAAASAGLGQGRLVVAHAAAGSVGSNSWLFERLGRAVVMALMAGPDMSWETALNAVLS